jgi:hypothetical protein
MHIIGHVFYGKYYTRYVCHQAPLKYDKQA